MTPNSSPELANNSKPSLLTTIIGQTKSLLAHLTRPAVTAVEQQEVKYGFSTLHTLTKGVSTVHGLKKANNGQTGKHLERVGMLNRGTMVYAHDPHSKKGGWVVGDQQHLIEQFVPQLQPKQITEKHGTSKCALCSYYTTTSI